MTQAPDWQSIDDRFPRLYWRLDAAAFEAFGRFGTVHDVEAGETVFDEGTSSFSLFLVLEGEIVLSHDGKPLAKVGKNFSFGEMGMLLDKPRGGTAEATVPSKLLELTRADIQLMQEKDPIWSTRLYRVLAECLAEYLQQAVQGGSSD